ncbi:MAG TPA: 2-oxoglutarate dehydrogenase E1 component [Polyangiaceae bacterium]|nr:2-oxoglutarate dehydrogenase E1 component [Polyangiaceae bacterium]
MNFEQFGINAGYVEELHARWVESPSSLDEKWQRFFASLEAPSGREAPRPKTNGGNGAAAPAALLGVRVLELPLPLDSLPPPSAAASVVGEEVAGRVYALINAYRVRGHLYANLNPLAPPPERGVELALETFGLTEADLDRVVPTINVGGMPEHATLREIVEHLRATYCGSIGVEFTQLESTEMRTWLRARMESTKNRVIPDAEQALRTLSKLTAAEAFEQFLAKNFVGEKRFSAEGAESLIPMLDVIVDESGALGVDEIVLGMAHRGRLNVLVNTLGKKVREIFAAFDDKHPDRFLGGGDVKYHLGYSSDVTTTSGAAVHLTMSFNPSHLEIVNPVVEGRVRAKQSRGNRKNVMPLLIHGDAAMMGQGIVAETLNFAGLEGYATGGTIHVVVNNQIGFTTVPGDSRSTRYCTDITRMMRVPVFHVNGDDPEAVVWVAKLAAEFRARYAHDVVIDMYCYRKYGHNEGDEPRFTQPLMYAVIDKTPSVREAYARRLEERGAITRERADAVAQARKAALTEALTDARTGDYLHPPRAMEGVWSHYKGGLDALVPEVDTAVPEKDLLALLDRLAALPEGFHPHPKVLKVLTHDRRDAAHEGRPLDWGGGEHLALASLLVEGFPVRLTGQDTRRGTFTHRHSAVYDMTTGASYMPLAHLAATQARVEIFDSPLSEAGVLGFEYGYSLDRPDGLVIWEAQFGDFTNGAQVIIDQFLSSAEDKWLRLSGLVLLLPHGYEGQGPEHSSARLERFLQLAAEDNMQVCNLTTPAQLFHALRRQVLRPWRKPLVVMTPKSLLRHKEAVSPLADFAQGRFQRVIPDPADPKTIKRVLLCSGKVYYDLYDARRKAGRTDVAIVRLEQLYPFNEELEAALAPYADGTPLVWVQEEPRNMGAWYFLNARLREVIGDRLPLSLASRVESASPATGSKASHYVEQKQLLEAALGASPPAG